MFDVKINWRLKKLDEFKIIIQRNENILTAWLNCNFTIFYTSAMWITYCYFCRCITMSNYLSDARKEEKGGDPMNKQNSCVNFSNHCCYINVHGNPLRSVRINILIHTHTHIYIYIYIYCKPTWLCYWSCPAYMYPVIETTWWCEITTYLHECEEHAHI